MLLPQLKEREYRFRLALRMGLPIFALILALVSHTLVSSYKTLDPSFYIESALLLAVSIYFLFYLIYRGFDVKITDTITQTFSREYLYEYLQKELKKKEKYTLVLVSVDNIEDINSLYGMKNGDRVLRKFAHWIGEYFIAKDIVNFPLGHIKSGDFVIGLKGEKEQYKTIFEMMCLKLSDFKVDDIEIKVSGSIVDSTFSTELDYLVDKLFELQEVKRNAKTSNEEEYNPSELEHLVIEAIRERKFSLIYQDVFEGDKAALRECFIKLQDHTNKLIHQKSYIKVLNKLGLMLDFDLMVFEEIVGRYMEDDNKIYALNISPKSLRNKLFYYRVKELLKEYPEKKHRVMFILNEIEYFSYIEKYRTLLNSLRDAGILITIDRIGAIQTSFLYFRELDIDCIRFDSFYTKEIQNEKYKTIVEGFNTIAHKNSIKSWLKMIEDEQMHQSAQALEIDYLQGKYLASLEQDKG